MIFYNKFCRENKIGFIYAGLLGLYGYAFVDYGSEFIINDNNGEPLKNSIITGITQGENAVVELLENSFHNFSIDDYVTFKELEGMEELNGQTYQIKGLIGKNSLVLDVDSSYFNPYGRGGIIEQVKVPKKKVFNSLEHCLLNPIPHGKDAEEYFDASKSNNFEHLHLTLLGLYEYYRNYKSLPTIK